jgi:hypothetical protein
VSDYYEHVKRAFIETLEHVGIPIIFKNVTRQCITGPIERKRHADVSGYLPQAASRFDMLGDHYADFVALGIGDRSTVQVDGVNLRIIAIDSEPSDPIVGLIVIGDK